jgi:ketosteroid isomerase-like protein
MGSKDVIANLPVQCNGQAELHWASMVGDEQGIIRALFDAFARRDVAAALDLVHPDVEFWPQGTAQRTQRAAPYRGHDGMREYFADVARIWDDLRVEPDDFRGAGAGVVVFGTAHGRIGAEIVRQPVIWVWKLRDGRVVFGRVVDTAAEAEATARERRA